MKRLKKLASVLLSLAVVFVMTVPTFAYGDTTYTLTINETKEGHQFDVYQIFTGDISESNGNKVLSTLKYGQNYYPTGKSAGDRVPADDAALVAIGSNAAAWADSYTAQGTIFRTVASSANKTDITDLPSGYYLVKDRITSDNKYDAVSKYILQVVGNTSVNVKSSVPTVTKKITNSGIDDTNGVDVADYNIGDSVKFTLTGTLPTTYDSYNRYKYVFHDTLSNGLTYDNTSLHVYYNNGTGINDRVEITSGFNAAYDADAHELTVTFNNLKDTTYKEALNSNTKIIVEYTAKLNASAVIGLDGNKNEVVLDFSNDPNFKGTEGNDPTGETPKDEVVVFTYELDITKVNGSNEVLSGAEFKLYKKNGDTATWAKIENGLISWISDEAEATTFTSDANGKITIKGLDQGTYYLKETVAPTGYNLLTKDVEFTISATLSQTTDYTGNPSAALTALSLTISGQNAEATAGNGDVKSGTVSMSVVNNAGTTLPSTGGMGTTIFYVVGAILVLAAVILLVTRRRMRHE